MQRNSVALSAGADFKKCFPTKTVRNTTLDNAQESLSDTALGPFRKQQDAERSSSTHGVAGARGRQTLSRLSTAREWRTRTNRPRGGTLWGLNFERQAKVAITTADPLTTDPLQTIRIFELPKTDVLRACETELVASQDKRHANHHKNRCNLCPLNRSKRRSTIHARCCNSTH